MLEQFGIALRKTLPAIENPDVVDSFVDAEVRANVTYGHYSHQIAYAASETPSRHCQVLRIRHFVRPCGFVCSFLFFFLVFVPVVDPQVSRPKVKKKRLKKEEKRKGTKKSFFFFRVKEQGQASYSSRP